MNLYCSADYIEDVKYVSKLDLPWEKLSNSSIMISGATGLLGSFLADVILEKNESEKLNCKVFALGRNEKKAKERFSRYAGDPNFIFVRYDVTKALTEDFSEVKYVLHLASNTHPIQYATDPIGTISTNIIGLQNMLEFASQHGAERFAFASSVEVYGENRGDVDCFDETYCGYLDSNTLRAGYPESKRCGEALCQAYKKQKQIDVVIPRFARSYGPTMLMSDTKALSQFIKNGVAGENIVLKSEGNQYYSYQYMADSISGLLTILLVGESGNAYNISDVKSDIRLKDLAEIIAKINGKKVIFELPDNVERSGYSTATNARLDGKKLKALGWCPRYDIYSGVERTIRILKEIQD